VGDEMPADPFREGQLDWGPLAANNFAFFSSHLAAGFSEGQAIELTARYLSFVVGVIYASQAGQPPGEPEA
jgi:hypothetical protein